MPIDNSRLVHALGEYAKNFEPFEDVFLASYVSDNGDGTHEVDFLTPDGEEGVRRTVRGRVRAWPGVICRISIDRQRFGPTEYCIIGPDETGYGSDVAPTMLELHGEDHGLGQPDQIPNLHTWQLYPLRVELSSGMTVRVLPGIYFADGAYRYLATVATEDLTAYIPANPGAEKFVTLSIDSAGSITVTDGTEKGSVAAEDIPLPPAGERPLCAIRLVFGDTTLTQSRFYADLRYMPGGVNASTAGDPSLTFHLDGPLAVLTDVGAIVVAEDGEISLVYIRCDTTGTAGTTTVDVNLNGVSIFAVTPANRPQLAWNDADGVAVSGAPDTTTIAAGDRLTFDIDAIATGARVLSISLGMAGVTS
jgi:hypothetical protein